MLHGWIIIDKPVGLGSTQAVGWVKRLLREAGEPKTKVGHGGTLDPLASGVLPIALGEATKLAGRMLDATKAYDFTIRFGEETDTLDGEGSVVETSDVRPSLEEIEAVLPRFTGPISQIPPAYSALKIDGKPAYARARAGEEAVEMKPREVTVYSLRSSLGEAGEVAMRSMVEGPARGGQAPPPFAADGPPPLAARGRTSRNHPLRHRLQRHLHPLPRPRHRPGAWNGRPCHHVAADQGRSVRLWNRRYRWTFWKVPLRRAH